MRRDIALLSVLVLSAFSVPSFAFNDIPVDHTCYEETSYFLARGYIKNADDFRPSTEITRAAALKMIFESTENGDITYDANARKYPYSDVPADAWFAPYVENAAERGIITWGNANSKFNPADPVNRAQFMKMTLLYFDIDPTEFQLKKVANDIEAEAWYAPFANFFVNFNIWTTDDAQKIYPSKTVSRCDGVKTLFRLLEAGKGLDTQTLLDISEASIIEAFVAIEQENIALAGYLSIISDHFSDRARNLYPQNRIVQSAGKVTEALKYIIGAYSAGQNSLPDEVLASAQKAWGLAAEAQELSEGENLVAKQIQQIAHDLAEIARQNQ